MQRSHRRVVRSPTVSSSYSFHCCRRMILTTPPMLTFRDRFADIATQLFD